MVKMSQAKITEASTGARSELTLRGAALGMARASAAGCFAQPMDRPQYHICDGG